MKFIYEEKVKVIGGFYKGKEGMIRSKSWFFGWSFLVRFNDETESENIKEKLLEKKND